MDERDSIGGKWRRGTAFTGNRGERQYFGEIEERDSIHRKWRRGVVFKKNGA